MTTGEPLEALVNLGAASAKWLRAVGVADAESLREVGPLEAYRRVRAAFPAEATVTLLYALHGALVGERLDRLPIAVRARLRAEAG